MYTLNPDTLIRIYRGGAYFERTWLEVQWDLRLWVKPSIEALVEILSTHGRFDFASSGFELVHPDSITEI